MSNFITLSRVTRPLPRTENHARFESFLAGNPAVSDVTFTAIDSAQAETCLLRRDGQLFLLWDENYVRWHRDVLSILLALPQRRAEIGSDALIFARVAELLNVAGHSGRAYVALSLHNKIIQAERTSAPQRSRLPSDILNYLLTLQEIFIFYHEIGHIALKRDAARYRFYHDIATEMINEEVELPIDRPVMPNDIHRWRLLFNCSDKEAEAHAHNTRRQLRAAFATLRGDRSATEELCCDLFAIDLFVETGFDLANENSRQCLYAAIQMQGQIQAMFNLTKQRCSDPEFPSGELVGEIAQCTQARLQARMLHLMGHIQSTCPNAEGDLEAIAPFRGLHEQIQALFDEIFVPRLHSILLEEEHAGKPVRKGAKSKYVRYGVFGPLIGTPAAFTLGKGSSRVRIKSLGGPDLHKVISASLGWGEPEPDEELQISLQLY
jgi:hypothetical protein